VRLKVRANTQGSKKAVGIEGGVHPALPVSCAARGFKRIRHCGLLASMHKAAQLARATQALAMPQPSAVAREQAQDFMRRVGRIEIGACFCCRIARRLTVQIFAKPRAPAPYGVPLSAGVNCRGRREVRCGARPSAIWQHHLQRGVAVLIILRGTGRQASGCVAGVHRRGLDGYGGTRRAEQRAC